ncbi:MAG: fumarylacetoacetate hydrolase family protein [Candidatus Sericytochromatia bacterium]|nr:fumarylacetoacetate hydrolase family protein [Candidatus Sericytochromatia bacterium]
MTAPMLPVRPSKILCIGRNYADHAAELGHAPPPEPLVFLKPPSALVGDGEAIVLPALSSRVDYEGELVLVIGTRCRNVSEADAWSVIGGYTLINDVTARDLQQADGQWARAKGFDTFAPVGPAVVSGLDVTDLELKTIVNGEVRQAARTSQLIFPIPRLIAHLSRFCTLEPGDLVATGTPSGVGPLRAGDVVEVWAPGIGTLWNPVVAEGAEPGGQS